MAVTAIPTDYNGVRFRSRLEAKWAAFFDRCEWRWTYEPLTISRGTSRISCCTSVGPSLVEVKPLQWDEGERDEEILQEVRDQVRARRASRAKSYALGSWIPTIDVPFHRLGMSMEVDPHTDEVSPWDWSFAFRCTHCGKFSFASESLSYHCRVKGCYDERNGRSHLGEWDAEFDFRRACSEVQWRPR
jgi:hypothetical protein